MLSEKEIQGLLKLRDVLEGIASGLGRYHKALVEGGFAPDQAMLLTSQLQQEIIRVCVMMAAKGS